MYVVFACAAGFLFFFFFNDTATTEIYTLSLHDALPIRYGYMNGIALTVLLSQTPKLFGFKIESEGPLRDFIAIVQGILGGKVNWTAFAIGAGTLMVILVLKRFK